MAAPPLTPSRTTAAPPRPPAGKPAPISPPARGGSPLLVAVLVLLGAASVPLGRVFVGFGFVRPVAAAILLSVGISWVTRRAGGGPVVSLLASVAGFVLLVSLAFLPDSLAFGIVPTMETAGAARDLWVYGMELVHSRPAPAFPEEGLLLLTVTGVWWVAHVVEGLVFRLSAPVRAVGMALVMWTVPLALAPSTERIWAWVLPFLLAAALVLLTAGSDDLARWGRWAGPRRGGGGRNPLVAAGWPVAIVAIGAGLVLGGSLPGFDEPPWYELRGSGGRSTLTTNPIVSIKSSLVELDSEPVARVTSPQPVYLRLTALDVYGEQEEWRSEGIRAGDASGRLPFERPMAYYREVDVAVEVQGLPGAVIVPVPYHPSELAGEGTSAFRYDANRATVTRRTGSPLQAGERYQVTAAVPAPPPDLLVEGGVLPHPELTALPGDVPGEVADLARQIVDDAGAVTAFEQALAIQEELRTWTYSLDPPQGHGATAMQSFITDRVGYCEQFAGTMAVMLRTLGIPSRVAVGYTPGELVDADAGVYQVRNANAHAWVEVLFDELGWIAFEPTPRSDGNVLVPSPVDLAPTELESEARAAQEPVDTSQFEEFPDLRNEGLQQEGDQERIVPPGVDAGGGGAAGGGGGSSRWPWALLPLLALAGGVLALASRRRTPHTLPSAVVLDALGRVQHVARGLGMGARPTETDAEFLSRVAPDAPESQVLARSVGRARWAPEVTAEDAAVADRAAAALTSGLLEGRSAPARVLLRARATTAGVGDAVRRRLRPPAAEDDSARGRERLGRLIARRRLTR